MMTMPFPASRRTAVLAAVSRLTSWKTSRVRAPLPAAALAVAACVAFAPGAAAQQAHTHENGAHHAQHHAAATTVIVVRHAERADNDDTRDPDLGAAGLARAYALADGLVHAGVTGIIATQYTRTRATARPLADRLAVAIETVDTGSDGVDAHVRAVIEAIRQRHAGGVVLVVGHSNTVPAIVRALGAHPIADMPNDEYGTMYIVTVGHGHGVRVIRARF